MLVALFAMGVQILCFMSEVFPFLKRSELKNVVSVVFFHNYSHKTFNVQQTFVIFVNIPAQDKLVLIWRGKLKISA